LNSILSVLSWISITCFLQMIFYCYMMLVPNPCWLPSAQVLNKFVAISCLKPNPSKRFVFCARVNHYEKASILLCLKMKKGSLLIRYLGVPLISKKLTVDDCVVLIERVSSRIDYWPSKNFTFTGRIQLLFFMSCTVFKHIGLVFSFSLRGSSIC
jgi:hypothetical protein